MKQVTSQLSAELRIRPSSRSEKEKWLYDKEEVEIVVLEELQTLSET